MSYLASLAFVATAVGILVAVLLYDLFDRYSHKRNAEYYRRQMIKKIELRRKTMGEWL